VPRNRELQVGPFWKAKLAMQDEPKVGLWCPTAR